MLLGSFISESDIHEESSSNTSSHAKDGATSVFGDSGELVTLKIFELPFSCLI